MILFFTKYMSEIPDLSQEDKTLLESLLDRQTTIKEIDTTFDTDNDTFDYVNKIGKDAKKYIESLKIPLLRVALARIAEKNHNILMELMNNFSENFPGWIYRERFYNPKTAKLPRTNRSELHSEYFRSHSTDDLFASIDASMQKHNIDPNTLIAIREEIKQSRRLTQSEIIKTLHPVFVDLLEEGYTREDLRA